MRWRAAAVERRLRAGIAGILQLNPSLHIRPLHDFERSRNNVRRADVHHRRARRGQSHQAQLARPTDGQLRADTCRRTLAHAQHVVAIRQIAPDRLRAAGRQRVETGRVDFAAGKTVLDFAILRCQHLHQLPNRARARRDNINCDLPERLLRQPERACTRRTNKPHRQAVIAHLHDFIHRRQRHSIYMLRRVDQQRRGVEHMPQRQRQQAVSVFPAAAELLLVHRGIEPLQRITQLERQTISRWAVDCASNHPGKHRHKLAARPAGVTQQHLHAPVCPHPAQPGIQRAVSIVELNIAGRHAARTTFAVNVERLGNAD